MYGIFLTLFPIIFFIIAMIFGLISALSDPGIIPVNVRSTQ